MFLIDLMTLLGLNTMINIWDVTTLPPLKKSRPEIRENTGLGLILGQDQGRHRVVKQTERKSHFIAYNLFTTHSLSLSSTTLLAPTNANCIYHCNYNTFLITKVFSSVEKLWVMG